MSEIIKPSFGKRRPSPVKDHLPNFACIPDYQVKRLPLASWVEVHNPVMTPSMMRAFARELARVADEIDPPPKPTAA